MEKSLLHVCEANSHEGLDLLPGEWIYIVGKESIWLRYWIIQTRSCNIILNVPTFIHSCNVYCSTFSILRVPWHFLVVVSSAFVSNNIPSTLINWTEMLHVLQHFYYTTFLLYSPQDFSFAQINVGSNWAYLHFHVKLMIWRTMKKELVAL